MIATLEGLTFVGDGSSATYTISDDGLKGWFGGVEMRRETVLRPDEPGAFDLPGYLGPRLITVEGLILTGSASDFENAMTALEDVLSDGSSGTFTVEQATGTYGAEVRRHGAVEIIVQVYGAVARYRLQLWAPSPDKVLIP